MTQEQRKARRSLFKLLGRLGVKSALDRTFTFHAAGSSILTIADIDDMVSDINDSFGKPDQLFVSPHIISTYTAILGNPSPAQTLGIEASGQSEEVPDDSRDQ